MREEHIDIIVTLRDALSRPAKNIEDALDGIDERARKASERLDGLDDAMRRAGKSADDYTRRIRDHNDEVDRQIPRNERNTKVLGRNTKGLEKNRSAVRLLRKDFFSLGKGVGGFFSNYFTSIKSLGGLFKTDMAAMVPLLTQGFVTLGGVAAASLGPIGSLLSNAAQILPAIGALATGGAVAKMAFSGIGDALSAWMDADWDAVNKAFKDLGPNAREFVGELGNVGNRFKGIQGQVQETFLEGLGPAVKDLAYKYLPALNDSLVLAAGHMRDALKGVIDIFSRPEEVAAFASFMEQNAINSGKMLTTMGSVGRVLLYIAEAAAPAFGRMLDDVGAFFSKIADNLGSDRTDLAAFFDRSYETAKTFAGIVGDIFMGIYNITQAAKPLTEHLGGGLERIAENFRNWTGSEEGQSRMTSFFENLIPNVDAIGKLIGSIWDAFTQLGESDNFAKMINMLAEDGVPSLLALFQEFDNIVTPALLNIGEALTPLSGQGGAMLQPLADALNGLAAVLNVVVPLFVALPKPVQDFIMYAGGIGILLGKFTIFNSIIGTTAKLAGGLAKSLGGKALGAGLAKTLGPNMMGMMKLDGAGLGTQLLTALRVAGASVLSWITGTLGPMIMAGLAAIPVVGWIIIAITALVGLFVWLWNNCEPFREFWINLGTTIANWWNGTVYPILMNLWNTILNVWNSIMSVAGVVWNWISSVIQGVVAIVTALWMGFWNTLTTIWNGIVTVATAVWNVIWMVISTVVNGVVAAWQGFWAIFGGLLTSIWNLVVNVFTMIWNFIQLVWTVITSIVEIAVSIIGAWIRLVWTVVQFVFQLIVDNITTAWNWIVSVAQVAWNLIITAITAAINFIVGIAQTLWNFIVTGWNIIVAAAQAAWDWISGIVSTGVNFIKGIVQGIVDKFREVWNAISPIVTPVIDTIKSYVETGIDMMKTAIDKVKGAFSTAFESAKAVVMPIIDTIKGAVDGIASVVSGISSGITSAKNLVSGTSSKVTGFFNKMFADGGEAKGGGTYIVGERGPEAFVRPSGQVGMVGMNGPEVFKPDMTGYVVPHEVLTGQRSAASFNVPASVQESLSASLTASWPTQVPSPTPRRERPAEGQAGANLPPVNVTVHQANADIDIEKAVAAGIRRARRNEKERR